MKTRPIGGWKWLAIPGASLLLLGCLHQSEKLSAQSSTPVVLDTTAAAPAIIETGASDSDAPLPQPAELLPPAHIPQFSPGLADIIKLAQSGVSEEVLLAYIANSQENYQPTSDEIVYLSDLGVSDSVIAELIKNSPPGTQLVESETPVSPAVAAEAPAPSPDAVIRTHIGDSAPAPSYTVTTPTMETPAAEHAPAAPQTQVTIQHFQTELAPYGTWVEVADYGVVWRPTVVVLNPHWSPYWDRGRWLYTDYGWYWHSDYSWGWAPFHYGRWHQSHRYGWVWVPGYTWAPAWVSWRYSPAYCGWAPLPPTAHYTVGIGFSYYRTRVGAGFDFGLRHTHYSFVPTHHFHHRHFHRHRVPHHHATQVYNQTTVINNYIQGDNNTVINEGFGRDRITNITRQEIPKVEVRELPTRSFAGAKPARLEREGDRTVLYRPTIPVSASAAASHSIGARADERGKSALPAGVTAARSPGIPASAGKQEAAAFGSKSGGPAPRTSPSADAQQLSAASGAGTASRQPGIPSNASRPEPGRLGIPQASRQLPQSASVPSQPAREPQAAASAQPATRGIPNARSSQERVFPIERTPALQAAPQPRIPSPTRALPAPAQPAAPTAPVQRNYQPVPRQPGIPSVSAGAAPRTPAPATPAPSYQPQTRAPASSPALRLPSSVQRPAPTPAPQIRQSTPQPVPRALPARPAPQPSVSIPRSAPARMVPSAPAPRPSVSIPQRAPAQSRPAPAVRIPSSSSSKMAAPAPRNAPPAQSTPAPTRGIPSRQR